jgi:hypothetical protein
MMGSFLLYIQNTSEGDHKYKNAFLPMVIVVPEELSILKNIQPPCISLEPSTSRRSKMNHLAILSFLLLASEAVAIPATKTLTARVDKIRHRDTEPSSYPGGDGPECPNEFRYLNFDVNDDQQLTHVQSAHKAFCTGWSQLLVLGSENINDDDRTVFGRFFVDNDDTKSEVSQVYSALVDTSNGEAKPIVKDSKQLLASFSSCLSDFWGISFLCKLRL